MKKFVFLLIILFLFTPTSGVMAMEVSVITPTTVHVSSDFFVDLRIDTGGESVNAFEAIVDYDEVKTNFTGYNTENSTIKLWIDRPNDKEGRIYLSGVVPGGIDRSYDPNTESSQQIILVRLLFKATYEGQADFLFNESKVLKNDGQGTPVFHSQKNMSVFIIPNVIKPEESAGDKDNPLSFEINHLESSVLSKTPSLLVFDTTDIGSGVKEYKIKIGNGNWVSAKSPHPLKDSFFARNITIRAIDFNGNFTDSNIYIPGSSLLKVIVLTIILVIFMIVLIRFLIYKL